MLSDLAGYLTLAWYPMLALSWVAWLATPWLMKEPNDKT